MGLTKIIDDAYLVPLGTANAVLLDGVCELAQVDSGLSGQVSVGLDTIRQLRRSPRDLRHLIFTHHHPDHIGSAAAIVRETGVAAYLHPIGAPIAETGGPFRPMHPAPGLMKRLAYRILWHQHEVMEPVRIDRQIPEGDMLPIAGGLQVIHMPGYCAEQLAFLCQGERMVMAGDIGISIPSLGDPLGFEDMEEGRPSQREIAVLRFDAALIGHGRPIHSGASDRVGLEWGQR